MFFNFVCEKESREQSANISSAANPARVLLQAVQYGVHQLHAVKLTKASRCMRLFCSHLISKGARLDHADHYGRQPIHVASGEDSVEIVKLLVEHGGEGLERQCISPQASAVATRSDLALLFRVTCNKW